MEQFKYKIFQLCILQVFILGSAYAQTSCTEFDVPAAPPQVVCPADITVSIASSATPTSCSAAATFQIPYQENPFSSTGINQATDGTWTPSGPGE